MKGKRDAARRWANYVNADETDDVPWRYLLVSEADIDTAKGSWGALKKLGGEQDRREPRWVSEPAPRGALNPTTLWKHSVDTCR